ncbi:MAG: hypothetical protein LBG87_02525 [Spirochaetaceae bacterium]|jgi:hypothetical protein|nr:hypothetical protein [Spirochaetaceae bacterium]
MQIGLVRLDFFYRDANRLMPAGFFLMDAKPAYAGWIFSAEYLFDFAEEGCTPLAKDRRTGIITITGSAGLYLIGSV